MADKQSREASAKFIGKLTVDLDVADAITGLKAVQREAREATKALRELEAARNSEGALVYYLAQKIGIPTVDLDNLIADWRDNKPQGAGQ